jgi:alpha-galactosidase
MSCLTLNSKETTLVFEYSKTTIPRILYWGRCLDKHVRCEHLSFIRQTPLFQAGLDEPYPLNIFPEQGRGFKGRPALIGHGKQEDWVNNFTLRKSKITKSDVTFILEDVNACLEVTLEFHLDQDSSILTQRSAIKNLGNKPYQVNHCAASVIPVPGNCEELLTFHGCWTGEFMTDRHDFLPGIRMFENRTGRTSHESFPGIISGSKGFNNTKGFVTGTHLGWSGNHFVLAERIPDGFKQFQIGELITPGEIILKTGEVYQSPWGYTGFSYHGLNGLSHRFHTYFRNQIEPEQVQSKPRPVQFNSWEAVYFDHNLNQLRRLAKKAADLGIERFVLDDGWFHKRCDDTRALGDWFPDKSKYPDGLTPLIEFVKDCGLAFGLWVEPEMINFDSDLYRKHPDWVMSVAGIELQTGRHQLVLDISKQEVFNYLYDRLSTLLSENEISYLKWDMNRVFTSAASLGRPAFHQYVITLYKLIDQVRDRYPNVEIETCASGGARIDFEILKRTHRFWTSDSNDPLQRQNIQKGASLFFPSEVIGSHIGPATCHTSGRKTTMGFRAMTSLFYHFGCEMDLLTLTKEEENELKHYIAIHKQYRNLFHTGRYLRLDMGDDLRNGYGCVAEDKSEALFCVVQMETPGQNDNSQILLEGLNENYIYQLKLLEPLPKSISDRLANPVSFFKGIELPGHVLMNHGITLSMPWPLTGVLIEVKQI